MLDTTNAELKYFSISDDLKQSWIVIDGARFFPTSQENIRKLFARWLFPLHGDVLQEIIDYLAQRISDIKSTWDYMEIAPEDYKQQLNYREYMRLQNNWTLLNTLKGIKNGR